MDDRKAHIEQTLSVMESSKGKEISNLALRWIKYINASPLDTGDILAAMLLSTSMDRRLRLGMLIAGLTYRPSGLAREFLEGLLFSSERSGLNLVDILEAIEAIEDPESISVMKQIITSENYPNDIKAKAIDVITEMKEDVALIALQDLALSSDWFAEIAKERLKLFE